MLAVRKLWIFVSIVVSMIASTSAVGQTSSTEASSSGVASREIKEEEPSFLTPGTDPQNKVVLPLLKHLTADQEQFWSGLTKLKSPSALKRTLPLAGFTSLLVGSDSWTSKQVPDRSSQLQRSKNISNYAGISLMGGAGGAYVLGHLTHNEHLRESGFLSGEAALNSLVVASALKEVMQRQRPYQGSANGDFFRGGSSFPSEHAALAWSAASVMAHEYPGTLTQVAAYGLASAVTLTRVTSKQHFASDVVVGSVLGWYFGRQVYRAHHDPELGGAAWGNLIESESERGPRSPQFMASPYVPLDSWVYPLFARLASAGYVTEAYWDMRPWTRMECARLLEQAGEKIAYEGGDNPQIESIYTTLANEFRQETGRWNGEANLGIGLDSIYARATEIVGPPLADGYHFGQTIVNDYGRPYARGFNDISGFTAHALAGPLAFFVQGEYQHAPGAPADSAQVLQAIAYADGAPILGHALPLLPNNTNAINRFRLLDSYVSLNLHNLQISFGQQSLWLGPTNSGPLLFSDNAEPAMMLRFDSVSPYKLALLSRFLGRMRTEFFLGELSGHRWVYSPILFGPQISPQPFIHGTKVSFKPSSSIEFSLAFTAMFGGPGLPFTWHNFLRTFFSHTANIAQDPGKRMSAFDLSYHLPGPYKFLTLYVDSMVIDEYSPLGSTRPSISPGIYAAHLPGVPKMDLRVEGVTTDLSTMHFVPGAVYRDARYLSGYTNNGNIMGSWIGRMGRGGQATTTYWFSANNTLQFGYRLHEADKAYLGVGGGRLQDIILRGQSRIHKDLTISAGIQYEQWRFSTISPVAQSNISTSIQLTWWPGWEKK